MGTRAELTLSDRTSIGFTLMNLNQQTLSDKVRLNEEPTDNTIYGMDVTTGSKLDFLTKAIDALPLISTKAPSDFTIHGEAAEMSPDPNTKKSTIGIDNGKAIAYIDDFEGAKKTIPFGVSYGSWHDMSVPAYQEGFDPSPLNLDTASATTRMFSKAKVFWYTIPNSVLVKSIWPQKSVAQGEEVRIGDACRLQSNQTGSIQLLAKPPQIAVDEPVDELGRHAADTLEWHRRFDPGEYELHRNLAADRAWNNYRHHAQ